jgi:hypothetical protein
MKIFGAPFQTDDIFFFNLTANVGVNSPNKSEDVQLVQFGYLALAQNRLSSVPAELITAASAVVPGAPYSGGPNDPLTLAIKTDERTRGGTQDGHISVIHGNVSYDGSHIFLLARLVNNISLFAETVFPRIDKHPRCPPQLAAAVRRSFVRSRS